MKLHRSVSVLGLFLILVAIDASAQGAARRPKILHERPISQLTPEQIAKMPVRALPVEDFKLLASNTGWVSTGNRLLWTKDNGAHWKDISPPNPNQDEYASIVFHDRDAGWVLFSHPVQDSEQAESNGSFSDWKFYLSRTLDGGATWTTEILPQWRGERGLSNRGVIAFADKQHGWLSLGVEGNTMTAGSALLVTSDGGRTWRDTPDANEGPEGRIEGILTISERDIWVLAAPEGGSALWATRDGGNSYQKISLSSPMEIAAAENPVYSLPVFSDSIHGYETVTYSGADGAKSAAVLFVSNDGGRTWKPDRILSNLVEQETVKSTVAGSRWIVPFASYGSKPTILKLGSNDRIAAPAHQSSGDSSRCDLNFSTPAEGWMNCSGSLSSTIDGGATWTSIQPRARNGAITQDPVAPQNHTPLQTTEMPGKAKSSRNSVVPLDTPPSIPYISGIDQHLGFDKSDVLSIGEMQIWWNSSPYYDVGIYAPGSPNRHNDKNLIGDKGQAWVDAIIGQGWGIIPVWFGLQAPCACNNPPTGPHARDAYPNCRLFSDTYSFAPDDAYTQGETQAAAAIASVQGLGLDGTVVYVDSEQYTSTASCGSAAQQYLSGFVDQMHESGGVAGIYGGLTDVGNFSAADDAWIARADNHATVWNLSHALPAGANLPDTPNWSNKMRIHQFRIDTNERWGSAPTKLIDEDIVDATVVQSSGVKAYTLQAPVTDTSVGLAAIGNAVNHGTALPLGTVAGYISGGDTVYGSGVFTESSSGGITIVSSLSNAFVGGINNLGQIVGIDDTGGYLYSPAGNPLLQYITGPNGESTELTSINDAGWILGEYYDLLNGIPHCLLTKPPYTNPFSFDWIGNVSCLNQAQFGEVDSVLNSGGPVQDQLAINGLGQIVGSTVTGSNEDDSSVDWSQVFVDDVESGNPGPSDSLTIIATTQPGSFLAAAGINNNGQIAGTYLDWNSDVGLQGFFINTDDSADYFPLFGSYWNYIYGLNDDVQMVGQTDTNGGAGFTIDSQH